MVQGLCTLRPRGVMGLDPVWVPSPPPPPPSSHENMVAWVDWGLLDTWGLNLELQSGLSLCDGTRVSERTLTKGPQDP